MKERKSVLIIGCGWLGKITGRLLVESGYLVTGTSRSDDSFPTLNELGITPLEFKILPEGTVSLPPFDVVLIALSPERGKERALFPEIVKTLAKALTSHKAQVIFCSSISVYGNAEGIVTETDVAPDAHHEHVILAAEGVLREFVPDSIILRLGGLYGPDRHPVKYLAGRKGISNGDAPVNLIHGKEVAEVIKRIIETTGRNEIFNVVAPEHPSRNELYTSKAREFGLEVPEFEAGGKNGKVVDVSKLMHALKYEFGNSNL